MTDHIDVLIEKKEAELESFRQRMDKVKADFTRETISLTSEWYRQTAREYVAKYPQVTLKLSEAKIALMKTRINSLILGADIVVKEEFDRPTLWWHDKPHLHDPIDQYLQVDQKYPQILDRAVRRILGNLGVVLEEYGFNVTASGVTSSYKEFWFERPITAEKPVPCYPHLLQWTAEMQNTIRQYDGLYREAVAVFNELYTLKEQKKQEQALNRWDSF